MNQARTPPLRVLMLLHNLSLGGVGIVVYHLAHELARIGCRPVVCGWRRGGPLAARFRAAGISVEVPPVEQGGWRRLKVPGRLREIVTRHRIDLIHAHMSDSAAWGVLLQQLTGRPCVVSHHGNDLIDAVRPGRPAYRWARHRLLLSCAARAATNVAVSESIGQRLAARVRLPPNRLLVVRNGIPQPPAEAVERARAERRRRAASRFAAGPGPTVLYVGRMARLKGGDTLIASAPAVLERFPAASFVFLGDGPYRAALRAQAHRLGLGDRATFPGAVADVGPWLVRADLFASASRAEGLPLAPLEAMSWGLPIVLSDIPGHQELARGGETGAAFPADAPDALARALVASLEDWPATEARAERALALVREEHRADVMARRHFEIYTALLAGADVGSIAW